MPNGGINGTHPGETVRKLLQQLHAFERTGHISPQLIEPNRLYDMAQQGDRNAKLLRNLVAQLLNKHTGRDWWFRKAALVDGIELLEQLKKWQAEAPNTRTVKILSSPAGNGEEREACVAGKREWLHRYEVEWPTIFASDKAAYATPSSMLIDDQWRKVQQYSAAGGLGVKFPLEQELVIPSFISVIHVDMDGVLVSTTGSIYNLVIEAFKWHRQQEQS